MRPLRVEGEPQVSLPGLLAAHFLALIAHGVKEPASLGEAQARRSQSQRPILLLESFQRLPLKLSEPLVAAVASRDETAHELGLRETMLGGPGVDVVSHPRGRRHRAPASLENRRTRVG
jgi:hypothetical protein